MHKQLPNYIFTPFTHYVTKTPEKAINTSPFRGCSFSDKQSMTPKKQNIVYHYGQQTINQNTKPQIPNYENASPLVHETKEHLMQRVYNLEDNLRDIVKKYDQLKEDLERERTLKCDTNRNIRSIYCSLESSQEREVSKHQQAAKSKENMYKQVQREFQEQKEKWNAMSNEIQEQKKVQEKLQMILKQKEREINDFKLQLKQEREIRLSENYRLVQEFTQTYKDLTIQNDQLIQENTQLKTLILDIDNQAQPYSSANQSQQNIQPDSDYLEDPQLRQIVQQYLTKNEEGYLDQILSKDYYQLRKIKRIKMIISDKQLRAALSIIKEIFQTVTSQQLKEIKSQQFQQPKQISEEIEINLQEARKKREFLIKEIKNKMDRIVKSKEFDLIEFNELQKEIQEIKQQYSTVENLIQEMEQQLILNPHRNSCVSFDDHEFQ